MKRMVLILALALAGCWRMTVRNGNPVGATPIEFDNNGTAASSTASRS